ncbi:hypothetical protein [Methylobacterium nodulans]|uniref:hypothetical protein n=1 Tax=Methylobacterium nodulans TaxID=114616 RepID=UPI001FCB9E53|nr:hypothetical protein [Methylobacterium nodulans]
MIRDTLGVYARINARQGWDMGAAGPLPAHYQVIGRDAPWPERRAPVHAVIRLHEQVAQHRAVAHLANALERGWSWVGHP